jgi:ketosteroid isomerase-like protein
MNAIEVVQHNNKAYNAHDAEAIAKHYAEFDFATNQCHNFVRKAARVNIVGNDVVATGKWTCALHGIDGRNKHIDGHYSWVLARAGDTWKIHKDTVQEGFDY